MHFVHYDQAAPYPGLCHKCGDYRDLFDLAADHIDGTTLLCRLCISNLSRAIGFVKAEPLEAKIMELEAALVSRETTINNIPNQTEELINGIRNLISDFIFTISDSSRVSGVPPVSDTDVPDIGDDKNGGNESKTSNSPRKSARK